jgi:hypothetical protein
MEYRLIIKWGRGAYLPLRSCPAGAQFIRTVWKDKLRRSASDRSEAATFACDVGQPHGRPTAFLGWRDRA